MGSKRYLLLLILVFSGFAACKKVDIGFGDQFLDNGYTQIVKVDSFDVDLTTIYVDSFVTSGKGAALVGNLKDPVFGAINAQTYLEMVPPIYGDTYVDSFRFASYDSLAVVLRPNKSWFGDTTKPLQVDVHRLAEPIIPYDNVLLNIYNTRSLAVQPAPLGSKNIYLRPNSGDSIVIRISDVLGKQLFNKFLDPNDADVRSNDAFLQFFYGLRISSPNGNQLIFGSKDSVTMRLYYQKAGLYREKRTIDFNLINKSHQFNGIQVDRSGTVLKDLATVKQIRSSTTGNTAYTLYAAGAMAKVRFPTIRDILKLPSFAKILKATLVVRPLRGSYGTGSFVLPPEIRLSTTTQLNQIGSDITFLNQNGNAVTQTGGLRIDNLYGENTDYAYDLTQYIRAVMNDATINQNGLLIIPPSPALENQFGRLVLGNHSNADGKMELLIVYAQVQ